MGYKFDLFIDQDINDEFKCTICLDVLKDPVEMNPCEHTYCRECAEKWQLEKNTCPTDRQLVTGLTKVKRYFMNILNELKMRCPFNGAGCTATFKLGDFTDHDERCTFNPENQKECAGGCGAILTRAQVKAKTHNCVGYLKEQLTVKDKLVQARDTELGARMAELTSAQEHIRNLEQNLQNEKDQNSRLEAKLKAEEAVKELAAVAMKSSSRGHLKRKLDIDIENETQAESETENETEDATGDEAEAENEEPDLLEMECSDTKNISARLSQIIASVVVAELQKWFNPENCLRSNVIVQKEIAAMLNKRPGPVGKPKWKVLIQAHPSKTIPINATTRVNVNFRNMNGNVLVYKLGSTPVNPK